MADYSKDSEDVSVCVCWCVCVLGRVRGQGEKMECAGISGQLGDRGQSCLRDSSLQTLIRWRRACVWVIIRGRSDLSAEFARVKR